MKNSVGGIDVAHVCSPFWVSRPMDSVLTRKMPCSCGCAAQLAALQLEVAALRAEWRNSPYFGGESGEKNGKVAKSATSTPWPPAETDQKTSKTKKKERTSTFFKRRIVASTLRRLVEQARPPKRARKRVSADEVWKAMAPADWAAVGVGGHRSEVPDTDCAHCLMATFFASMEPGTSAF